MADRTSAAACDWWEPLRLRRLAELDSAVIDYFRFGTGCLDGIRYERERVVRPGWIPERVRRMPTLGPIAAYWSEREPFAIRLSPPHCFRCQIRCPRSGVPASTRKSEWDKASRYLERAHLVDHALGGLDGPQNLVPLCHRCHRAMPMFDIGEGAAAIAWVLAGPPAAVHSAPAHL